ncbi:hypothetical protein [Chryseobacterium sp. ISL-6]|uniref:hypothetical protein n=1 Tax=Chryseobacterium sp. ISL-6 TaxID=2819143 RepID=UPI001BED190E|nr:hypothetical protein [Chryseobacterium sp. ISL-6]MBT2621249.1 hypothetical protein [Chryseobacterium sp. ISL-6]
MKPQKGQLLIIQKYFNTSSDSTEVIAEAGNDTGNSFLGSFIVKIKKIGIFRFNDGLLIRRIK